MQKVRVNKELWDLNAKPFPYQARLYIEKNGYHKKSHKRFKVGDVVTFWTGYNDDIRAKAIIRGFDDAGGIFVYTDCYWFPIKDDERYKIERLES